MPLRIRRRAASLSVTALAVGVLAGCADKPPSAQPVADALAVGLTTRDLAAVPLSEPDAAKASGDLTDVVRGMGDRNPKVAVESVATAQDAKTATATMRLTWDLDAGPDDWSYTTTAPLVRQDKSWSVVWGRSIVHPDLEAGERLVVRRTTAPRGEILGADGAVLVTARSVARVGIDKTKVSGTAAARSARRLAAVVRVDPAGYAQRVADAGAEAFVEAVVLRTTDVRPLTGRIDAIPGAVRLPSTMSLAPNRTFARPILGVVGAATAEIIEKSGGAVRPGDLVGLSGLQARYDDQLRGLPGLTVSIVPAPAADGSEPGTASVVHSREPRTGASIETTLDREAQQEADDILASVKPASAIVAIRPSTGDVIAAASGPGAKGQSTATVGRFPPGSTFKVVDALALLRDGRKPTSTLPCTRTLTVEGKEFRNYSDYPTSALGTIPLRTALANSCNTAFISQNAGVSAAELASAAASLGLGVDQALGLPAFLGSVPSDGGTVDHAAAMIGQARVQASPLAMATVAASVAAGRTVAPRMVLPVEGAGEKSAADPVAPDEPVTKSEAATLRQLMRAVVTDGSGRLLSDVPGQPVGAKTGTAEFGDATPRRTHGWMIAVRGDLAVAVFVHDAESGSKTAGPLLERFLRAVR